MAGGSWEGAVLWPGSGIPHICQRPQPTFSVPPHLKLFSLALHSVVRHCAVFSRSVMSGTLPPLEL